MIRYFDMFSGIGGFRAGLERAGGYECVGHCEIDKRADAAYRALFNVKESEVYYEDARKINTEAMPDFDLLCAGFPCQAFSVAGRRKGFSDPRGALFFEIARVARARKPAYLLLENVPGLLSHDRGRTFGSILRELCELGYGVEWQVLNSKDFGVPQSRRRVYIICYLNQERAGEIFPVRETNTKTLIQLIGGRQGSRVYDSKGLSKTLLAKSGGPGGKTGLYAVGYDYKSGIKGAIDNAYTLLASNYRGLNRRGTQNAVFAENPANVPDHVSPAQEKETARRDGMDIKEAGKSEAGKSEAGKSGLDPITRDKCVVLPVKEATKRGYTEAIPGDSIDLGFMGSDARRGRVGRHVAHTLNTSGSQGVVTRLGRIRRLMPRECFRLQGFSDEQIDRILSVSSDTQAYKLAGNAVTVNVVHALGIRLKAAHTGAAAAGAGKEAAL